MSVNKIQVAVNGKTISSKPIERILVRGEKDSNVIVFTLNRIWNGIDISASGIAYQVLGRNADGNPAVDMLRKGSGTISDTFTLTWEVSSRFTNSSGPLDIWINALRGNKVIDLNWNTNPVRLYVNDGFVISDYEPITQQLVGAIAELTAKSQENEAGATRSAENALNSKRAAKESENTAKASEIEAVNSRISANASEQNSAKSAAFALKSELNSKDNAGSAAVSIRLTSDYASRAHQSAVEASNYEQSAKNAAKRAESIAANVINSVVEARDNAEKAEKVTSETALKVLMNSLFIWNPATGLPATIQEIFNSLFYLHADAILPEDFDTVMILPEVFDAMKIDPYDFDTKSKDIFK